MLSPSGQYAPAQVMDGRGGRPLWPMLRFMFGTVLIMVPMGGIHSWARLKYIVTAYLQWKSGAKQSVTVDDMSAVNVSAWIACSVSMLFLGRLTAELRYPKIVVLIGASIGGVGLLLSSMCTSLVGLIFCYGVFTGVACGAYIVPLYYVIQCFPHTSGVLIGFTTACFSAGEIVQNQIAAYLLDLSSLPGEDSTIPYEVYKRLPWLFRSLSLIYVCCLVVGTVALPDPKEVMLRVQFDARYNFDGAAQHVPSPTSHHLRLSQLFSRGEPPANSPSWNKDGLLARYPLVKQWYFWLLPLMAFITFFAGSLVTTNAAGIRERVVAGGGTDDSFDSEKWAHVSGLAGRLAWGLVADALGYHYALVGSACLSGSFILSYGFVRNISLFHMWTCCVWFSWAGAPAVIPTAVGEIIRDGMNAEHFAFYYPLVFLGSGFGLAAAYAVRTKFLSLLDDELTGTLVALAFIVGTAALFMFPVRYYRTPGSSGSEHPVSSGRWNSGSQEAAAAALVASNAASECGGGDRPANDSSFVSMAAPASVSSAALRSVPRSPVNSSQSSNMLDLVMSAGNSNCSAPAAQEPQLNRYFSKAPPADTLGGNMSLTDVGGGGQVATRRGFSTLPRSLQQ
eukprot:Rhum_TRINITY_DN18777_c0_g1::Rhum_TRINITY_DN18777_c0_g1_i1::g.168385::m.168385